MDTISATNRSAAAAAAVGRLVDRFDNHTVNATVMVIGLACDVNCCKSRLTRTCAFFSR